MNIGTPALRLKIASTGCLLLCFSTPVAFAEEPGPINTERPSFSSSPLVLPTGYWQIETGYQFTRDTDAASFKDHSLPNMLIRFGFHENLELQLGGISYKWQQTDELKESGVQDATLGIKWQVNDSDSAVPVGLYGGISLPVGDPEFSNDSYDPSMGVFWTHSSALQWFGAAMLEYSDESFTFDNGIGISLALPSTDGAYVEYLLNVYEDEHADSTHTLNLGASWLLSNNLQFDINGGIGLNSRANDYYTGMGLSYRF